MLYCVKLKYAVWLTVAAGILFGQDATPDPPGLTAVDVQSVVRKAAESADSTAMVIAVTNRQGHILAIFRKPDAPKTATGNFGALVKTTELAVALARTASF